MNPLLPAFITAPVPTRSGEFALEADGSDSTDSGSTAFKNTFKEELAQNKQTRSGSQSAIAKETATSERTSEPVDTQTQANRGCVPQDAEGKAAGSSIDASSSELVANLEQHIANQHLANSGEVKSEEIKSSNVKSSEVKQSGENQNILTESLTELSAQSLVNTPIETSIELASTDILAVATEGVASANLSALNSVKVITDGEPGETVLTANNDIVENGIIAGAVGSELVSEEGVATELVNGSLENALPEGTVLSGVAVASEQQTATTSSQTSSYLGVRHANALAQQGSLASGVSEHVKILADDNARLINTESEKVTVLAKDMSNVLKMSSGVPREEFLSLEQAKPFRLSNALEGSVSEQLPQATAASHFVNASLLHRTDGARMQMPINISFGQPEWAGQIAERAAMMGFQKIQSAELQLDPPELGSLQVKVSVSNDHQATVTFSSPHAAVREALDQTLARLRELLEQQGLNLVDVNVSDQQQKERSKEELDDNSSSPETQLAEEQTPTSINTVVSHGIDFYA